MAGTLERSCFGTPQKEGVDFFSMPGRSQSAPSLEGLLFANCDSMAGMSEKEPPRCYVWDCGHFAEYKCDFCERDICLFHRKESGDDDLCPYCKTHKFK